MRPFFQAFEKRAEEADFIKRLIALSKEEEAKARKEHETPVRVEARELSEFQGPESWYRSYP